jgi:acetyl-CoA carboxylase biotin carboxyl carrier protein
MKKINDFTVSSEEGKAGPKIDFAEINKLIAILEEKKLSHFELEIEGFKIKISRNTSSAILSENLSSSPGLAKTEASQNPGFTVTQPQERKDNVHYVTSPMVGTFYRAPNPNSPPFVDVGDTVKKKQTLCIIEAMKLMNEIEAEIDGVVQEVYVENGKPIEFGQKLFALLPIA